MVFALEKTVGKCNTINVFLSWACHQGRNPTVRIRGGVLLARRKNFFYFPQFVRHIKNYLPRLEMLAYYTRRKNMHFTVVNRAWTTSIIPARLLILHFFCAIGLMSLYWMLPSWRHRLTCLDSLFSSSRGALPNLQFHHVGAASFVNQLQMHDLHYHFPRYIKYFLEKLTQYPDQTNFLKMRRLSSCLYHLNETQSRTFLSSF